MSAVNLLKSIPAAEADAVLIELLFDWDAWGEFALGVEAHATTTSEAKTTAIFFITCLHKDKTQNYNMPTECW
jgi:hypothetical protein